MEVAKEMEIPTGTSDVQAEDFETLLITYLTNILKCQIMPMPFLALRDLVAEAPQKLKLYAYIEEKYPNDQFLDFLKKYPNIFTVYPDRTVVLTDGNNFAKAYKFKKPQQQLNRSYDVVDGKDKEEYISNSESSEDEEVASNDDDLLLESRSNPDAVGDAGNRNVADDSTASSISESTVDMFSSEIVQTSDSDANSLSSTSSLDN